MGMSINSMQYNLGTQTGTGIIGKTRRLNSVKHH